MSKLTQEQKDALSNINAMISVNADLFSGYSNMTVSTNPLDYLLRILLSFVSYDKLVEFLSQMFISSLPALELSIKTILISQLKRNIDCSNDPRIPNDLRKEKYSPLSNGTDDFINRKGIYINLKEIDYENMLSISPLSIEGSQYYFGTSSKFIIDDEQYSKEVFNRYDDAVSFCKEKDISLSLILDKSEIQSVYELARAEDFNAFLWFVIHKSHFYDSQVIKGSLKDYKATKKIYDTDGKPYNLERKYFTVNNNLGAFDGNCRLTTNFPTKPFIVGDTLLQKLGDYDTNTTNVISLCIKSQQTLSENTYDVADTINDTDKEVIITGYSPRDYNFTFVPVSSDYKSANWYANSSTYYNFILPENKREKRDYSKEYAICNLQYLDKVINNIDSNNLLEDVILFSIMPKPFIHLPNIGEPIWRGQRILFDNKGVASSKGKYSVEVVNSNPSPIKKSGKIVEYEYNVSKVNAPFNTIDSGMKLRINVDTGQYYLYYNNNGQIITSGDEFEVYVGSVLYECYPGLTVYEFNYDYVMSLRLFDPKTIVSSILLTSANLEFGLNVSKTRTAYQMRIAKIVQKMIESDGGEVSDCFFSFSNDEYENLLSEAELKRSKLYPFANSQNGIGEINKEEILKALQLFDNNSTLEENTYAFTHTISQVTASVTSEILPEDKYNVEINFITTMIKEFLLTLIIKSLLTPKVIMLLIVNRRLMGYDDLLLSIEDLLNSLTGIIVAIVKEIRDLILRKILDFVLEQLGDLLLQTTLLLVKEQAEYYTKLIKMLVENCTFNFNRNYLDSNLDEVYYADIDENMQQPQSTNC